MWPFTRTAKPDPLASLKADIEAKCARFKAVRQAADELGYDLHRKVGR